MALPPGPLDDLLGKKKRPAKEVLADIKGSDKFANIVERAVNGAEESPNTIWGQTVRQRIVNQIEGREPDSFPA